MTQTQKIIKYIAISLAILLIVSIFYSLFGVVSNILGISFDKESSNYTTKTVKDEINYLNFDLTYSKLTFKIGNEFKVESNNEYVVVKESKNKISIEDKTRWFSNKVNNEVIVYIPENTIFEEVVIEAGSGNINIENLNTKYLDMDLGAGSITFDNLYVSVEADIDSGAGKLKVLSGNINNLDLDMGIGEVLVEGILVGNNDIDAGIGTLNINLNNSVNNYKFIINKGIGEIRINNEIIKNKFYNDLGNNIINIDGGIGSINVTTVN